MPQVAEVTRPAAYRVDSPIMRVQTIDQEGDHKFLFRHDFMRLDAGNIDLLYQREKETKRVTEKMTKGRTRSRLRSEDADRNFYRALVISGGWRPYGLNDKVEEGLIEPAYRQYYNFNSERNVWEPGWQELTQGDMFTLTAEKMNEAIERWGLCRGHNIGTGTIDFMFEKSGIMKIGLHVGDDDDPAYKLLMEMRRPDSKRRTRFKEDFAYAVDNSKGGLGNVETVVDLRAAISFFDEYFAGCPDDKHYSEILLEDKRAVRPADEEPRAVSAVINGNEDYQVDLVPYQAALRDQLVATFNPNFKVEIAAATVQAFSKTDQEL